MVVARQSKLELDLVEPMMSLRVSYDGPPRVDAKVFEEEVEKSYQKGYDEANQQYSHCLLYTSPSPRDRTRSRMPSSA